LQGVIAALLGRPLGLPRWWIPIQMVLPPAAALASMAAVPAWVPLALFVLLTLVFWNSARSRVPLYLTNRTTELALASLVPPKPGAKVLDIGHGLGAAVMALARIRPDIQAEGIENAPIPFALSWARNLVAGPRNARLIYGDFWRRSLAGYDLVYAFLSPAPMSALYAKAKAEMDAGSVLVSNTFAVDGIEPDEVPVLDDARKSRLNDNRMWTLQRRDCGQSEEGIAADDVGDGGKERAGGHGGIEPDALQLHRKHA